MVIIYFILLFILAFILLLLLCPLKYKLIFFYDHEFTYQIYLGNFLLAYKVQQNKGWQEKIYYLFSLPLVTRKKKEPAQEPREDKDFDNDLKKKPAQDTLKFFYRLTQQKFFSKNIFYHFLTFIKDIFISIKPSSYQLKLALGLEDPSYNGYLAAIYYQVKSLYPGLPLFLKIKWERKEVKGEGKVIGSISLGKIVLQLLFFIFSLKTLRFIWQAKKAKKNLEIGY